MRGDDSQRLTVGGEHGFTIVEVVVGAMVLLVGLLSLLGLFNDSRDQNATGERTEIAVIQAEQAIEELRGLPYEHLMLSGGAADPTGGARVVDAGASVRVTQELTEPLVYYTSEGKPQSDAWVDPVTEVSIGVEEVPLELTIHRFVSWRDEECRVADLGQLGVDLPAAITTSGGLITNAVNSITGTLLGLLSPSIRNLTSQLKSRLTNVNSKLAAISAALAGVSEVDLCDLNLSLLGQAQKLGRINNQLPALNPLIGTLQNALNACLPLICNQNQVQSAANQVNAQLNCMFSSTGSSGDTTYLDELLSGVDSLANDVSDSPKNAKRLTVAVVVEPRVGVAPTKPIWMSTVVRDPSAGLLTSGGASCV